MKKSLIAYCECLATDITHIALIPTYMGCVKVKLTMNCVYIDKRRLRYISTPCFFSFKYANINCVVFAYSQSRK